MSVDELLNYLREEWLSRSWGRCGESKEGYGYKDADRGGMGSPLIFTHLTGTKTCELLVKLCVKI